MEINDIIRLRFPHERTQGIADDLNMSYSQIANRAHKMGLKKTIEFKSSESSGRENLHRAGAKFRFTPGHTPFNKGKLMSDELYQKCQPTMFKKGNRPSNWKPDGTIIERSDKYLYYKVKDSHWILYHHKVWKDAHGEIPDNCVIRFKDGNQMNCVVENLQLISLVQNMEMNTIQRFPTELQQIMKLTSKLKNKINGKK